jgi:hypothetical protein
VTYEHREKKKLSNILHADESIHVLVNLPSIRLSHIISLRSYDDK